MFTDDEVCPIYSTFQYYRFSHPEFVFQVTALKKLKLSDIIHAVTDINRCERNNDKNKMKKINNRKIPQGRDSGARVPLGGWRPVPPASPAQRHGDGPLHVPQRYFFT